MPRANLRKGHSQTPILLLFQQKTNPSLWRASQSRRQSSVGGSPAHGTCHTLPSWRQHLHVTHRLLEDNTYMSHTAFLKTTPTCHTPPSWRQHLHVTLPSWRQHLHVTHRLLEDNTYMSHCLLEDNTYMSHRLLEDNTYMSHTAFLKTTPTCHTPPSWRQHLHVTLPSWRQHLHVTLPWLALKIVFVSCRLFGHQLSPLPCRVQMFLCHAGCVCCCFVLESVHVHNNNNVICAVSAVGAHSP